MKNDLAYLVFCSFPRALLTIHFKRSFPSFCHLYIILHYVLKIHLLYHLIFDTAVMKRLKHVYFYREKAFYIIVGSGRPKNQPGSE